MNESAPTSNRYGDVLEDVHVIVVDPKEWEAHCRRVEALSGVLRDLLLAASDVPPFSMMISAEQKKILKSL